ncbi:tetratricopeptide repeat protein [Deinococcus marmoris]|uniref:Tetratricopeptide repeat family protein n=1 Tax=Deinococcus marmoris TaxID=249408 RepID=A0A1U7P408_9DEIO|nr:tetratricopeptide repeat protein [Deinococcus marmoris]OLV19890.1 tetratricopeptide repeat family protein [Deinococcus marmoris]
MKQKLRFSRSRRAALMGLLPGLLLGFAGSGSAQTMIDTVTSVGIQNTLNSATTIPKMPTLPTAGQNAAAQTTAAQTAAQGAPAQATPPSTAPSSATPPPPVTPLTPAQQAGLDKAQVAYDAKNYAQARSGFEALVAQNYGNPEPHFGLALSLLALGNDKGAAFELRQFVTLAPDRYEGPYNLGVIAGRGGDHAGALQLYGQAATLMVGKASASAQRQVLEALATEQTRMADFTALSATLTQITALAPDDLNAAYRLAQARTLAGQGAEALPGLYALLQADGTRMDAALLLADIYMGQGLPDRALRELDAAVKRVKKASERSALLLRKADILAAGNDTRGAVLAASAATKADKYNARAFAREGELRALRNDRPGAQAAYLNAVRLAPDNAMYRTALAGVRLTLGRFDEAAADTALALKLKPDAATSARALYVRGIAAYRQNRLLDAVIALKESHKRRPDADTALWLGLSYYAQQDYAAAAGALADSVRLSPTPTARLNLASALLASARYPEAEAVLRGLVTEDPKAADAWYMLGLAQRSQRQDDQARVSLKTAANLGNSKAKDALK